MSTVSNLSVKEKLLSYFFNPTYNTFTAAQARARFGITNVSARINELRKDGFSIYTNTKKLSDGRKITFYRLGNPSKRYTRLMNQGKVNQAVQTLYRRAA